jgi:hypothetical protein
LLFITITVTVTIILLLLILILIYIQKDLSCEMVVDMTQCDDSVLGNTDLSGKCGVYSDNVCKLKCSELTINGDEVCNGRVGDCYWLYSDLEGNDGECKNITEKVDCSVGKRYSQCPISDKTVNVLSNDCFWIYSKTNTDTTNMGICRRKDAEDLTCGEVIRSEQCMEGLEETSLNGKCLFDSTCKWICDEINVKNDCENRNDCVWIYSSFEINDDIGNCYPKNKSDILCKTIIRENQCNSGGGFDKLQNDNGCTFVKDDEGGEEGTCESKV